MDRSDSTAFQPLAQPVGGDAFHALRDARWIWPTEVYAPLRNVVADFVLDLPLGPHELAGARLAVTADANYAAWINGQHVGRGPARGWQASWPCDEYAVGELLREGHNRLAFRVYNPGRDTFRYVHANAAGLLAALVDDRGRRLAATGGDGWRCRVSPARSRVTPQLSIQLEDQEHVDLRRDESRWRDPDATLVDDRELPPAGAVDAAGTVGVELRWRPPAQVRAFGSPPWHDVEPRGLPTLTNQLRPYARLIGRAVGPAWQSDVANPPAELRATINRLQWSRERGGEDARNLSIPAIAPGELGVAVLDFGEATIGTICLSIDGGSPGARLDVVPFEVLDDDGRPALADPLAEGRVAFGARLTLPGGATAFESMHAYGHRYLALVLWGDSRGVSVRARVRETLYPVREVGRFKCDDGELNAIRVVCARTQRVAMTDAYIDAWREQAQWWGDARVQFANHQALDADDRLFRRGVRQIATQRLPNGLTYGHAPTGAHTCVLPDFSLAWLLSLTDHWWQTGSPELAVSHRGDVESILRYFRTEGRGRSGLLCHDPRYWLFLDWADIPKEGCPTLLNLWHLHALDRSADAFEAAGDPLANRLREEAAERRGLLQRLLFDADVGRWRDGLCVEGEPRDSFGTHAQALAILCGFDATPEMVAHVRRALSPPADVSGAEPSPFWIGYVFEAATRLGLRREVIDCIRRRWQPMVRQGSTFEVWRPTPQESRSHAWSAHPLTHLNRLVAGVAPTSPGWATVDVRPPWSDDSVNCCATSVPTPRGLIRVEWQKSPESATLALDLPAGIAADVLSPDASQCRGVTRSRRWHVDRAACRDTATAETR